MGWFSRKPILPVGPTWDAPPHLVELYNEVCVASGKWMRAQRAVRPDLLNAAVVCPSPEDGPEVLSTWAAYRNAQNRYLAAVSEWASTR